jgi:SAM-dependent methyltransferase
MNWGPARVSAAARYIGRAGSPLRWRLSVGECPLCTTTVFLSFRPYPILTRCLRCGANATNLSLIPVIKLHFKDAFQEKVAYELSTYGSTLIWLKRHFPRVIASEYIPDQPRGSVVDGILNQDVQELTFDDSTFDLVTSNQVFEHVPDDIRGFVECYRVLRPGGAMILSVPLYSLPTTQRIANLVDSEVVFLGEPEYHDSRIGGARSAPVFWRHSIVDIAERVGAAGFRSVKLVDVTLVKNQSSPTKILYAVK